MTLKSKKQSRGFTLLEIMLVIFLIGIMTTLIVVNISPDRDPFSRTSASLMLMLKRALAQASQEETLYGLAVSQEGWALMAYKDGRTSEKGSWTELVNKRNILPEGMTLSLKVEGLELPLSKEFTSDTEPQLWFYPGGETSIFELTLKHEECKQSISAVGFMTFNLSEVVCRGN